MVNPSVYERCEGCGLPVQLGGWLRWDNNGRIFQKISPTFRVILMEANFMDDLFGRIEKALGISIRHIVFEA